MSSRKTASKGQSSIEKFTEGEPPWASALCQRLTERFDAVSEEIKNILSETAEELRGRIVDVEQKYTFLQDKVEELEFHSRKYNLIVWGLGANYKNCEEKLRDFFKKDLEIDDEILLQNCHTLPENNVIVRFVRFSDRERVLRSGRKLKGKKISMKTDLPPKLRALRVEKHKQVKRMREDNREKMFRVVERGRSVFIEARVKGNEQAKWEKLAE